MKKLFVFVFAVSVLMIVAPSKAEAGYLDRGGAIGVGTSIDIDAIHSFVNGDKTLSIHDRHGLHITGKIPNSSMVLGLELGFLLDGKKGIDNLETLDFSMDWWLINPTLIRIEEIFALGLYIGPGLSFGIHVADQGNDDYKWYEPFSIDFGLRLPMGLSFVFLNKLELYTEFLMGLKLIEFSMNSPEGGFFSSTNIIDTEDGFSGIWKDQISKSVNIGVRYWF